MNEKLKGSDIDSATVASQQTRRQQPGAQGAGRRADALDKSGHANPEKLKENRDQRLHVGADHKTPEMKKGKRGTFP